MYFEIDGVSYQVGVLNLKRDFSFYEKYRAQTEDGVWHRGIAGVYKNYTLTLGNVDKDVYDQMLAAFTSGNEYSIVKIPDGKVGFVTFKAMFEGITDELLTERNGIRHWDNLVVKFTAKEPVGVGSNA